MSVLGPACLGLRGTSNQWRASLSLDPNKIRVVGMVGGGGVGTDTGHHTWFSGSEEPTLFLRAGLTYVSLWPHRKSLQDPVICGPQLPPYFFFCLCPF